MPIINPPPGKVNDLKANLINGSGIFIEFTATGEDFDKGTGNLH